MLRFGFVCFSRLVWRRLSPPLADGYGAWLSASTSTVRVRPYARSRARGGGRACRLRTVIRRADAGRVAGDYRAALWAGARRPALWPELPEDAVKQRPVYLADLAAVAVKQDDPDRACTLAEQALDQLGRYWYATGMDRVRAVRQSLGKWESRPCVRRLDERLYDWTTTVSALTG